MKQRCVVTGSSSRAGVGWKLLVVVLVGVGLGVAHLSLLSAGTASGTTPLSEEKVDRIKKGFKSAELVIEATVVGLGEPPGMWSGRIPTFQEVRYDSARVLKGTLEGSALSVRHPVVYGAPTADEKEARLRPSLFATGSTLFVFARQQGTEWVAISEHTGTLEATDEVKALLEALVRK